MSENNFPKLHNAMWPGLVGKGDDEGQEPPISLEHMLDLPAAAEVDGQKFEGIDYFLFLPHTDPEASDDELKATCSAKFEAYRVCMRQWQQAEKERRVREGDTGFRKMTRQISGVGDQSS